MPEPGYNSEFDKYMHHPKGEGYDFESDRNEEVDTLMVERNELKDKYESFLHSKKLRREIDNNLVKLTDEKFDAMVDRISKETTVFNEISDTVKADNIIRGLAQDAYPTPVEFGVENAKRHGAYNILTGKVEISRKAPSKAKLWNQFAISGMPRIITTVDHELVHHYFQQGVEREWGRKNYPGHVKAVVDIVSGKLKQSAFELFLPIHEKLSKWGENSRSIKKLAQFTGSYLAKRELKSLEDFTQYVKDMAAKNQMSEVVAQKASRVFRKDSNKTTSLVEDLRTYYGFTDPKDVDKAIVASQQIDRLRAVGQSDETIALVMSQAKYDVENSSFPEIEKMLENAVEVKGNQVEDLDSLVDVHRIKSEVQTLKSAVIAQEEILKVLNISIPLEDTRNYKNIEELFSEMDYSVESMNSILNEIQATIGDDSITKPYSDVVGKYKSLLQDWKDMQKEYGSIEVKDLEKLHEALEALEVRIRVLETTTEFI